MARPSKRMQGSLAQFLNELHDETDRGAAVLGAAFLEEYLQRLIKAFLVDHSKSSDLFDGASPPLGTLSAKIAAAFAMGLVTADERQELDLIRKIRNEFAHELEGLSFEDDLICNLCNKLKFPEKLGLPGIRAPRWRFDSSVVVGVAFLVMRTSGTTHQVVPSAQELVQVPVKLSVKRSGE
jgi:mannitol operon repressor